MSGTRRCVALAPRCRGHSPRGGALLLWPSGGLPIQPIPSSVWFQLASTHPTRAVAAVYSSESGAWSHIITVHAPFVSTAGDTSKPGTLAGNAVYWLIPVNHVLEFDTVSR